MAVTVQLCSEPQGIMEQEVEYLDALMSARSFKIEGNRLEILDPSGAQILVFIER
jgi:heat shock protein HslJ